MDRTKKFPWIFFANHLYFWPILNSIFYLSKWARIINVVNCFKNQSLLPNTSEVKFHMQNFISFHFSTRRIIQRSQMLMNLIDIQNSHLRHGNSLFTQHTVFIYMGLGRHWIGAPKQLYMYT